MALTLAMVLDAIFGEPAWLWSRVPHPVVLSGRIIAWFDRHLNRGTNRRLKGVVLLCVLVLGALGLGYFLSWGLGLVGEVVIAAILLAQRSLCDHLRAVANGLRYGVRSGRSAVAMIVSRDTRSMDENDVTRSALESGAENLSDGVIAPIFWFAIGGLPGLLVYKITNTADSMVGYKTEKYADFGWAAARFDDLLNLVPARLTAGLLWVAGGGIGRWSAIQREAHRHKSPNAGWPEAALSRALGIALSGPRSYDGQMRDFPFVNPTGRRILNVADIDAGVSLLWRVWGIVLGGLMLAAIF